MYLTALTHREQIFDVACRWLADRVQPADGRTVTEIFVFERILTAPVVRQLVADLLGASGPGDLWMERVTTKDQVRRAIAAAAGGSSQRVASLIDEYRRRSEEFFPRTPVHMTLVSRSSGELVGMVRRKRLQRTAEKASRKIADQLASTIEESARALAARRAAAASVALADMVSPADVMEQEFVAAERLVADRIRSGEICFDRQRVSVNDVIGIKLIGTPGELARIEDALGDARGFQVNGREVHNGHYAGTHLLVDVDLPPVGVLAERLRTLDWSFAAGRGLSPRTLETELYEFLGRGARSFRIELVLTTFEDLVESEFGRCIHEARILDQRQSARYSGRIAENAAYIIEYLFHVAISPTVEVTELPIKIWGRYLRDTLNHAILQLGGGERPEWLLPPSSTGRQPLVASR